LNRIYFICISLLGFGLSPSLMAQDYVRAVEGKDNVRGKLFDKERRLELNGPDFGMVLNQSYIQTYLLHGGLTYYFSETWGVGAEVAMAMNSDKSERECIENFFNNPSQVPSEQCPNNVQSEPPTGGNFGPAYVPIRELKFLLAGNAVWSPVYGKQIMFMRSVVHFDLFVTMGGGLAMSDYYGKLTTLNNGRPARKAAPGRTGDTVTDLGIGCDDDSCRGIAGRPTPEAQATPYLNFGLGQKFHFQRRFHFKVELRNMTLVGTESGFENLVAVWGGFGARF